MKGPRVRGATATSAEQHVSSVPGQVAFWTLALFLLAVLAALAVTLLSVSPAVKLLAGVVVVPIVAVTLILLYFERKRRKWSFAAAGALGVVGVTLRLIVNSMPSLEVGGGLPVEVTVTYVALGLAVVGTSLWSLFAGASRGLKNGT